MCGGTLSWNSLKHAFGIMGWLTLHLALVTVSEKAATILPYALGSVDMQSK